MRRTNVSGLVLLLIPILVPVPAQADPPCASEVSEAGAAKAAGLVRDANTALDTGRVEDAFSLFARAYCVNPEPTLRHGLSQAALALGRCDDAFKDALSWVQHGDPADRSEAIRWLSAVQEQCVEVSIGSEPSGATLHLDNMPKELGLTPWAGRLRSGAHSITASRQGFSDAHHKLSIPPGPLPKPLEVRLTLRLASTESANDLPFEVQPEPSPASVAPPRPEAQPTTVVIDTSVPPGHRPPTATTAVSPDSRTEVVIETGPGGNRIPPPVAHIEAPPPAETHAAATPPPETAPVVNQVAPQGPSVQEARPAAPPAVPAAEPVRVVAEPPKPRPPPPAWVRPAAWTAIGVGAAALLVGTVLGAVAHNNALALRSSVEPGPSIQSQVNAINASNNAADALFGIGGALAAAGIGIRIAY